MECIRMIAGINPKLRTNRVPSKDELPNLRFLTTSKDKVVEEIEKKIREAEMVRDAAIRHCESLMHERDTIIEDFNQLEGLIHPIRRTPEDIIQYIFKWVFWVTENPSWAQPVSQVCQYWRNITLQTPLLWSCITLQSNGDSPSTPSLWKLASERVKSVRINLKVTFRHNAFTSRPTALLKCPISVFENFSNVDIWIQPYYIEDTLSWIQSNSNTANQVIIRGGSKRWITNPLPFDTLATIISSFRPTSVDTVYIPILTTTTAQFSFPTVRRLAIALTGSTLHAGNLFWAFPSLEELQIRLSRVRIEGFLSAITLAFLRHLELYDPGFPWELDFDCPILESVHIHDNCPSPAVRDFILNQRGIRSITCQFTPLFYPEVGLAGCKMFISAESTSLISILADWLARRDGFDDDSSKALTFHVKLEHEDGTLDPAELTSTINADGSVWSLVTQKHNDNPLYTEYIWRYII